jgi:hypothetical protein
MRIPLLLIAVGKFLPVVMIGRDYSMRRVLGIANLVHVQVQARVQDYVDVHVRRRVTIFHVSTRFSACPFPVDPDRDVDMVVDRIYIKACTFSKAF